MTIKISGQTFAHKELIKACGGMWNGVDRIWTLPDFTPAGDLERLRKTPGIVITMPDGKILMEAPEPREPRKRREPTPIKIVETDDLDKILRVIFGNNDPDDDAPVVVGDYRNQEFPDHKTGTFIHGNDETWLGHFNRKPTAFFGFASFADMLEFIEATPGDLRRRCPSGWEGNGGGWTGTRSMSEALDLARHGWPNGIEKAKRAAEIIEGDHAQQRQRKHSVAGGRVNVGRMLSGSPLHMVHRPRQDGVKIITLHVDVWMSSGITAENAIIRAACVAAISDVLEASGYSCEIVAVGSAYAGSKRMQVATVVKQAGDALNLEDVTFALGHPSMLRRFCFALAANEPDLQRFWDSMGMQEAAFVPGEPGCYYINKLQRNISGSDFDQKVRDAFKVIVPDNFPMELKE